jgi:hypothetical protein
VRVNFASPLTKGLMRRMIQGPEICGFDYHGKYLGVLRHVNVG